MQKIITIDFDKCTGCRICESVCSFSHAGEFNPELSRIRVIVTENEGLLETIPVVCATCEEALCQKTCPVGAIYRSEETGARLVHEKDCLGCKSCFHVCPVGGTMLDFNKKIATRCDLCGGDPLCVKYCPTQCLEFRPIDKVTVRRVRGYLDRAFGQQLKRLYEEIRPGSAVSMK